jgi:putative transposase
MERKFKSNHNIVYSCKYHVVWCTKYRRPVLVDGVDTRLKEILQEVVNETSGEILELEVMPDHTHVLVEIDPQYGICKLVRIMKGRSSRYLRQEFPWVKSRIPTLWTNSYFVATVGGAPLKAVKEYIQNQKNV